MKEETRPTDRPAPSAGGIAARKPCRSAGITVGDGSLPGGKRPLVAATGATVFELDERELALWMQLDGSRTLDRIVLEGMAGEQPASPLWTLTVVSRLAHAGLLEGEWELPSARSGSRLLLRFGGPLAGREIRLPVLALGTVLFVWLPLVAPLFIGTAVLMRGIAFVPAGTDLWGLLLALLAGLLARQAARAAACLSAGHALQAVGVELVWGVPLPGFDLPELPAPERLNLAWWGLGALALTAGAGAAGALLAEAPACDQLLAAGILLMFVDLGPVFPGDGAALLESWTGRGASGEPHGGSRSSDRLSSATRPTARPPDGAAAVETRLTFAAIGAALWALLAVRFGASLLSASIEGIRESTGTGHARLDLFLGALVLVVLAGGLGCGLARLSGVPIRWASGPAFLGNRAARLMLPIALLAVPALTLGPPGLTALAHVCVLGLLLVELPRLASETRGSRLAVGLWSLLAGIVLQALATVPLALAQLGLFDSAALPNLLVRLPGDASWLGLAGLGAALTAEVWRRELAAGKALTGGVALCTGIAGAYLAGTVWGALEAVALGLAPAAALALLLGHEATPLRHFWRTFILAASCLAASVWAAILPQAGFWVIARLHVAGLLFLAAALRAGHIALCIPVPRQAARPASHGSSDICGALQSGAGQVFTGLLRMTGDFLGADLAVVIARDFDARPGGAKDFPLRFDAGRAVIPLPSSTGLREAVLPLRMALCFLQDRIVDSGGVLFFDQALSVAAADLGLMEWEVVQALLLPGGPVSLPWRGTLEELRRFPLFSDLTEEHLSSLEKALRRERHPDGACVVRQGERGDRFFLVRQGVLAVTRAEGKGRPQVVAYLRPGDGFGEMALLSGGVRNASVVADGPVELASLGAAEFDAALVDRKNVTPLIRHGPLLQRVPLFTGLPAFVLGRLAAALEAERFADGAEAVSEGAPLQRLLIVREGRLEGPGVLIGPGDVHGQQALGGAEPASPRLRARGPSSVLWLECAAVRESIADWLASLDGLDELDRRLAAGTAPQPD